MSKAAINQNQWLKLFKQMLKENFAWKFNKQRLIAFLIALVIVLIPSLTMNLWAQNQTSVSPLGNENAFWHVHLATNTGMGFSLLENNVAAVYAIQILINLIAIGFLLWSKNWYLSIAISLVFCGGFFNVFDRASPKHILFDPKATDLVYNAVIDYFQFNISFFQAIFNFPDMFILIGIIGGIIIALVFIIMEATEKSKKQQSKKDSNNKKQEHDKDHR